MSSADAGMANAPAALPVRWLRPWNWMLAGLAANAAALAWARVSTEEQPPLDLVQLSIVTFGTLAAGIAVWQRCTWPRLPGLDDLVPGSRSRILLLLALAHGLTALAVSVVLIVRFNRPDLPGDIPGMILLWLLAAPWCTWSAWQLWQRSQDGAPLGSALEAAVIITEGGLAAFMGSWAFFWGPELGEEWDSLRLFLAVLAGVCFLAASIAAAPPAVRRVAVSGLIVVHFAAILTAVIGNPPGPWIVAQAQQRLSARYLEFMYLVNGYRFYSPEPSPASQLWCRIEYERGKQVFPVWVKLPDMDKHGNPKYPTGLQYTRSLALTEAVARTEPMPSIMVRNPNGEMVLADFARLRDEQSPVPMQPKKLGEKALPNPAGIPMHPDPTVPMYQKPGFEGRQLLGSYARFLLRQPPPANLADTVPVRVKIYRVQHRILTAQLLVLGEDPWDLTFYLPYYNGQFDREGRLLDPDNPFLYWVLPIVRNNPSDPKSPLKAYIFQHAGDPQDLIINPALPR
jgi:hypothetical protein